MHTSFVFQLTFGAARRSNRVGYTILKNNRENLAKCIDHEHGLDTEDGMTSQRASPHVIVTHAMSHKRLMHVKKHATKSPLAIY